ncbi:hypothetical protein K469DRAFT_666088 [Zopfia rhizophila CBS 207.26]|uniref:Uncharacterized protein n=1 Tax=Zopfia rhizophila CBS 207.26 TaxID=1314779 RepID=A0A6A6E161_9PEZI|nr:hypothetical protein K469DRAFT_666088 [Zopfia rhizophila CBS 207.26]
MPIPSPSSSLKPRSQISKPKDATTRPESSSESCAYNNASQLHRPLTRLPHSSSILQHNADGSKRRSFLPQRGELKSVSQRNEPGNELAQQSDLRQPPRNRIDTLRPSTSSTTSQQASVQALKQARSRPQSLYQTSSARTGQQPQGDGATFSRILRPPDATRNATAPQPTSLHRSQSLRKPGAATQSGQSANIRAHSKALSTSTATSTRKEPAEHKSQSERPKSLLVAPDHSTRIASNPSTEAVTNGIRSSARIAALKRSVSIKSRSESPDSSESPGTTDTDQPPLFDNGRRREPVSEVPKKQARPAFSTLQQHFTPRKTGKAPTSTFLHPPAPDAGSHSLPQEIISLQTELLQLHLLHESAAHASRQWELNAKKTLHRQFDEVASMFQVMRDNERSEQERKNILALNEWSSGNASFGLVEHIQLLSAPLHELPSMVDPGGRFSRLVDDFDHWITWVEEIWSVREQNPRSAGGDLRSAEGMGGSWKAENAALTRKLTAFSCNLDRLTRPAPGSSIACIVSTCKDLLEGMLDELQTMQTIEMGVVARGKEWVEDGLQAIAQDIGAHLVETKEGSEPWRM